MEPILLVEDNTELRAMLRKALEKAGYAVEEAADGAEGMKRARGRRYLAVLSDLRLPGCSGLDLLREARQADPTIPVILVTAYGSVAEAVAAMKEGAFDFVEKPVDLDHLLLLVERAARERRLLRENLLLREEYAARYGFPRIVGEHPLMQELGRQVQRLAATNSSILLLGESGTGKELIARAIHHLSARRDAAFVALNCAAIPEGLVENELFGHERGAYTGAGARKLGKIELAHRGTLFLDEIADLPPATQGKLLRVVEEHTFERVGGTGPIEVDVRILAATNKDLEAAVAARSFRADLYFRIASVSVRLPALRERGEDTMLLAEHFLERYRRELRKPALRFTPGARDRLLTYRWPGNVRELANAIERAIILSTGETIDARAFDLPDGGVAGSPAPVHPANRTLKEARAGAVAAIEREKIEAALRACRWNRARAASSLGISYKTLLRKIRALGIDN